MKKIIGSLAAMSALVFLAGCGTQNSATNPTSPPTISSPSSNEPSVSSGTQQPETANTQSVSIQNLAFNPGTLTIKKGTTVTWTNNDSVTHTIKSATFNSGDLAKGDTFQFTFNTPGTFDYSCGIHPFMTGKIIVE